MKSKKHFDTDKTMSIFKTTKAAVLLACMSASTTALASGGLDKATNELQTIQTWMYSILGVLCGCVCIWEVAMALMNKKQWSDVIIMICKTIGAGAVIAIFTWSWGVFGS